MRSHYDIFKSEISWDSLNVKPKNKKKKKKS